MSAITWENEENKRNKVILQYYYFYSIHVKIEDTNFYNDKDIFTKV